jgi:hypothetical protein
MKTALEYVMPFVPDRIDQPVHIVYPATPATGVIAIQGLRFPDTNTGNLSVLQYHYHQSERQLFLFIVWHWVTTKKTYGFLPRDFLTSQICIHFKSE